MVKLILDQLNNKIHGRNQTPNNKKIFLQPSVLPGNCWCFEGTQGYILIKVMGILLIVIIS